MATTEEKPATILVVDHSPQTELPTKKTEGGDDCHDTISTTDDSTTSFSSPAPMDDPDAKPSSASVVVDAKPSSASVVDDPDAKPTQASQHAERQKISTTDHKGSAGIYSGRVLTNGNIPDGPGTMEYENHPTVASYTGHWSRGAWMGQGQATLLNGDSFSGEHQNGARHGSGTYTWSDGRSYAGTFAQDQRHGQGSYTWPCGANYCGAYDHGVRTGYGKYLDPTEGISYQGDWRAGVYQGYGVLTTAIVPDVQPGENGSDVDLPKRVYRGNFDNGQAHGQGVEILPDGTIRHDGMWKQGVPIGKDGLPLAPPKAAEPDTPPPPEFTVVQNEQVQDANGLTGIYRGILHVASHKPHGNGVLAYDKMQAASPKFDDQLDYYEGCLEMGCYHGRGRLHWRNGDCYDGNYVMGKRQGQGTYKWSDGRHYKGDFLDDMRHGFGKFVYGKHQSADWYEGEFVQGRREGKGRFVFADGSKYDGQWKAGVYHGVGTLISCQKDGGTTYSGTFHNGLAHGQGKETAADGTVTYEGNWIQGDPEQEALRKQTLAKQRMASESTLRQPRRDQDATTAFGSRPQPQCEAVVDMEVEDAEGNRGQYTGLVLSQSRKPHGVGRMVYLDGRRIHEGFWENGMKHGHGRCLFVEQGDFHEGEYKNNVRHGPGKYKWRDGRVFVGQYFHDMRNGKGVFTYPNGEQYEGNFVKGEKHGHGRFEFRGGFYVGDWEQGRYHGRGRLSVRGEELEGIFRDGEFVGKATCDVHGEAPTDEESKEAEELVVQQMESVELGAPDEEEEVTEAKKEEEGAPTEEKAAAEKVETSG